MFLNRIRKKLRSFIAASLSASMLVTGVQFPAFADTPAYQNRLDGWNVDVAWSTMEDDYEWNADSNEIRQPKIVVTYRIDNAEKDYPAGSLQFDIPGIGGAYRGTVKKADKLAADQGDSEWDYEWDQASDTYSFTNNFSVNEEESVSGGFEMLWTYDARDIQNGYLQEKSPVFSIDDVGSILMDPLSFNFTSERDLYRMSMSRSELSYTDYENADLSYVWYDYTTRFNADLKSRGLYRSDYYVTVELPDGVSPDDVVVKNGSKTVHLTENEDGEYGFYVFQNRSGDVSTGTTHYEYFTIGFKESSLDGQEVTVRGHLSRLYDDETEYVDDAADGETVDVEDTFTIQSYRFQYTSMGYGADAYNTQYENFHYIGYPGNHDEPDDYTDRLNAVNLYNGKVVQININGTSKKNYAEGRSRLAAPLRAKAFSVSTPSSASKKKANEPEIPDFFRDWNDIRWKEHGLLDEDADLSGYTYGDVHISTPSDAGHLEDEDGWSFIPDIEIIGDALFDMFGGFEADAAEKTTPSDSDKKEPPKKAPNAASAYAEDDEAIEEGDVTGSGIPDGAEYSMALGADTIAAYLNNGSVKALEDEEYGFGYVTVSKNSKNYDYEVYGADSQDTPFDEYVLIGAGNTKKQQTIAMSDSIKAAYVLIKGVEGSCDIDISYGIRLHLDWDTEQAKDESERIDHENRIVVFDYVRALYVNEDGEEINDAAYKYDDYGGSFGKELADRDFDAYGEYLYRNYSNVWLRSPVMDMNATTNVKNFTGNGKVGFSSEVTASGSFKGDNEGPLSRMSLYVMMPEGLTTDLDNTDLQISGTGYLLDGSLFTDFIDYVTISERTDEEGRQIIVADFDFSNNPLESSDTTSVNMKFGVSLDYASYVTYGNRYTVRSFAMAHDDGLDKISGKSVMNDTYDLDNDGQTDETIAYSSMSVTVLDDVTEWREYASKYVKSSYSSGYESSTVAKMSTASDNEEAKKDTEYSYRLDFGLGSSNAKDIVFYDNIESGATIVGADGSDTDIGSEWHGNFVSVDTSYAESLGLIPTIYYSADQGQAFDLSAGGWSTTAPSDPSSVRSVAISLDTSGLDKELLPTGTLSYVIINMKAPSDRASIGKDAVNQYTVEYDAYGLTEEFQQRYSLSSSETSVTLLDTVGSVDLRFVDADNQINTDEEGNPIYSTLTGGRYQVYDPSGKPLFGEEGRDVNSLGKIPVSDVQLGIYTYEQLEAPAGYQKIEGRHEFEIDGVTSEVMVENHRIPGEVVLTADDLDNRDYGPLTGVEYSFTDSEGNPVYVVKTGDGTYEYSPDGGETTVVTGSDGTVIITGLPWDGYIITQTSVPEGYEVNTKENSFRLGKDLYDEDTGKITAEINTGSYELTADLLLIKTDSESGKRIDDAVYSLYKENASGNDELVSSGYKTNAMGEISVTGLKFGTYYFMETRNPGGYEMPSAEDSKTDSTTLGPDTAGETVEVSHENVRMNGDVVFTVSDDEGQLVGNADYELYYRPDTDSDGEFVKVGDYTTSDDSGSDEYGEIRVDELPWGDYYFVQTGADDGYEVSDDHIEFTVDRDTVQNTIYVDSDINRATGTVKLVKVDKADNAKKLEGAVYELYNSDGSLMTAGKDYELPQGASEIKTGSDGSVILSGIRQGAYYFKEKTAPSGYSISNELIRFSVTMDNVSSVQELIAEDEAGKAAITIVKTVDEVYEAFGEPSFMFTVTSDDGSYMNRQVTLSEDSHTAEVTVAVNAGHKYTVTEANAARYGASSILAGDNASVVNGEVVIDLTDETEGKVTFSSDLEKWNKFSHTGSSTGIIKSSTKLTGIGVEYHGPDPITQDLPEYDSYTELYTIPKEDLTVTAFYDDGTSKKLSGSDYVITPETADGSSNSFTGTVIYEEGGIERSSTFQFGVQLPTPTPRHTVTFDLDGGTIVPDGGTSAQSSLVMQVKEGRNIEKPENDPVKEGYIFKGWYIDKDCTEEAVFPIIMGTSDKTIYAKWEQDAVKVKYAVSIYGIQHDVDENGIPVGLTFGPATGASYINTYKSHTPSEGQMCMHDMTWEEIIAQSKKDPSVFQECLENGCTHSVELTIKGKLSEGATSYPNMSGDGTGILYESFNDAYRDWNRPYSKFYDKDSHKYEYGSSDGGWPDSAVRNTLNGITTENMFNVTNNQNGFETGYLNEENALISSFPEELKTAIVPKQVKSDISQIGEEENVVITYDKLFLLSLKEWGGINKRPAEGTQYEKKITGNDRILYDETGKTRDYYLRTMKKEDKDAVYVVRDNGDYNFMAGFTGYGWYGFSPCFCLPGPEPSVKYAVSLYGIKHDQWYDEETSESGTAGLTFGPATGTTDENDVNYGNYKDRFVKHMPTGNTASGNPHRCIHDDDWSTIAEWSQKDPYVYEQCYGDEDTPSCTKSVLLFLNEELANKRYVEMYGYKTQTGDGAGALYCLMLKYVGMNGKKENEGGWSASRMRNVFNGVVTDNGNALDKYTALISAFPAALKSAIVPKAVKSDTTDDVVGNNVTTYDKLWLFSVKELYGETNTHPNEGELYQRQKKLGITENSWTRSLAYENRNEIAQWWLRTVESDDSFIRSYNPAVNRPYYQYVASGSMDIAPGFCLK